ncbi:MAG: erg26, C-3 sterol dehydrogenase [Alyxoria varia]|nr:MAG: erg26, C-3 sterol dehydrogenase [Alyxoria varia]
MNVEDVPTPVLIVGGCGLLGRYTVADLIENAKVPLARIAVLDKHVSERLRTSGVQYFEGDIADLGKVETVFDQVKPQVVFDHASPPAFAHDMAYYMEINSTGTQNLLKAARSTGTVKAFVYTSSSSVIHDSISDPVNVDEAAPVLFIPEQKEHYHHSKAVAESLVLEANRKDGSTLLTASLRPSGLFGNEDPTAIQPIVENAKTGKYRFQIGDGKNLYDWTYIENAARAHLLAAKALINEHNNIDAVPVQLKVNGEAFFITNDEPVYFWDFVRSVGAAAGFPTPVDQIRVIPKPVGLLMATDPPLLRHIRRDTEESLCVITASCSSNGQEGFEVSISRLRSSALFANLLNETLRTEGTGVGARMVNSDVMLADRWFLREGSVLLMPHQSLHPNEAAWGVDAKDWSPGRFARLGKKAPSTAFQGFGGGKTKCPGSFLAASNILILVAVLSRDCDLTPVSGCWTRPRIDLNAAPAATPEPVERVPVRVSRREGGGVQSRRLVA